MAEKTKDVKKRKLTGKTDTKKTRKCFNLSHLAKDYKQAVKCFTCNQPRHKAADCVSSNLIKEEKSMNTIVNTVDSGGKFSKS